MVYSVKTLELCQAAMVAMRSTLVLHTSTRESHCYPRPEDSQGKPRVPSNGSLLREVETKQSDRVWEGGVSEGTRNRSHHPAPLALSQFNTRTR